MKSFICSECGVQFASKTAANRHFKSSHSNKLGFACRYPNCAYKGSRADTVKRHMYRHSVPSQPSPLVLPTSGTVLLSSSSQPSPPQNLIEHNDLSQAPQGITYNLVAATTLQDGSTSYHTEATAPTPSTATHIPENPTPNNQLPSSSQKTSYLYAGQMPDNHVQPTHVPNSDANITTDIVVKKSCDTTVKQDTDITNDTNSPPEPQPSHHSHSTDQAATPSTSKDYYAPEIIPISDTDEDSEDEEDIDGVHQINSLTTPKFNNEAHTSSSETEENSKGKFISGTMAMAFSFKVYPTAGDWFRMNDKNELVKKELLPGQVLQVDKSKNLKLLQLMDI